MPYVRPGISQITRLIINIMLRNSVVDQITSINKEHFVLNTRHKHAKIWLFLSQLFIFQHNEFAFPMYHFAGCLSVWSKWQIVWKTSTSTSTLNRWLWRVVTRKSNVWWSGAKIFKRQFFSNTWFISWYWQQTFALNSTLVRQYDYVENHALWGGKCNH